jgi:hypothetical protein
MKVENVKLAIPARTASNKHKVPVRQWRKWSATAKTVFNGLYAIMRANQLAFLHPKQESLSRQKWGTVAWNAAWIAADEVDGRN